MLARLPTTGVHSRGSNGEYGSQRSSPVPRNFGSNFQGYIVVAEPDITELNHLHSEELLHLHRGQGLDIIWRDTFRCPTEQEYIQMARWHSVLRLSVKIMMAFATTNVDVNYVPLVDLFGIYGQIRDDYMNLQSQEYTNTKGLADDISEGKFSFPVIHNILKQRPKTSTLKHQAIAYLKDTTHSFDYTLCVMRSLEKHIQEETARLGGNPILKTLLERLHQ
ncbi:isoprenoid synthase domain-containing protein [Pisolithus orientalis]|uniref:isoprenoid synthase domain-containing protein n=1 Tax=Pisolithus orientalis TaxID=936130 RepID=UPI002225975B|nr:isoprenoid synthase domain-containing protein [Pisolithus orientalis]KAI6007769.1 isoprenoid synthase domain-containing protein [Pisolithus orientalis]